VAVDIASFVNEGLGHSSYVVDARKVVDFAAGHIPGSLSIELRPVFASVLRGGFTGWSAIEGHAATVGS